MRTAYVVLYKQTRQPALGFVKEPWCTCGVYIFRTLLSLVKRFRLELYKALPLHGKNVIIKYISWK